MKKTLWIAALLQNFLAQGQQNINVMFYNLYRYPDNPPSNREFILKEIVREYPPDLLMVCELVREAGADRILNNALQTPRFNYDRAAFTPTITDIADPLQQMVFYNKDKLTLLSQQTLPTAVREINWYSFILNTPASGADTAFLDVFVAHLKSSEGSANQRARLYMIDTVVKALATIPAGHHVLLAGDFNFYSAYTEPAYQKILDPLNPVIMVDPIHRPGRWSDNDSFKDIHTQATRTSATGFGIGGATGGLDDRFDFIMMSQSLETGSDLWYLPGSYKAFGNNGNCFNERIDDYACEGTYSLELRRNLHNMSDHLPVIMQLQTDRHFLSIGTTEPEIPVSFPEGNIAGNLLLVKKKTSFPDKNGMLTIYNTVGQCMKTVSLQGKGELLTIDTRAFPAGIYYLGMSGGSFVKFLKQ